MSKADFTIRPYSQEDVHFIHNSWARSYYKGSGAKRMMSPEEFNKTHRPMREDLFLNPKATFLVCSDANDSWTIVGWLALEKIPGTIILHYVYVKERFKNLGIGSDLIKAAVPSGPVAYTHITQRAREIMAAKPDRFKDFHQLVT